MADPTYQGETPTPYDDQGFPWFDFLSGEVLVVIMQYLHFSEIGRCCRVSKRLQSIANDNSVWRFKYIEKYWPNQANRVASLLNVALQRDLPPTFTDDDSVQGTFRPKVSWKELFESRTATPAWIKGKSHPTARIELRGHRNRITCMQATQSTIVSGSLDYTARVWDTFTKTCQHEMKHTSTVVSVAFNDARVITCAGTSIPIWSLQTGEKESEIRYGESLSTMQADASFTNLVAGLQYQAVVHLWDIESQTVINTFTPPKAAGAYSGRFDTVSCLQFDGNVVLAALHIVQWDIRTREGKSRSHSNGWTRIRSMIFDSEHICVTGSEDKAALIWDMRKFEVPVVELPHGGSVNALGIVGKYLVTGGSDRMLRIYDIPYIQERAEEVSKPPYYAKFVPAPLFSIDVGLGSIECLYANSWNITIGSALEDLVLFNFL